MILLDEAEALKEKENQPQEVKEELHVVQEKLIKLTAMDQIEKEGRDHLMQETLKRALEDENEASIWKIKEKEQVKVETTKVGDIIEKEQDLILLQEKVKILKMKHNRELRQLQKEKKELKDSLQEIPRRVNGQ